MLRKTLAAAALAVTATFGFGTIRTIGSQQLLPTELLHRILLANNIDTSRFILVSMSGSAMDSVGMSRMEFMGIMKVKQRQSRNTVYAILVSEMQLVYEIIDPMIFAGALSHEIGHAIAGHLEDPYSTDDSARYAQVLRENLEADSLGFHLAANAGIHPKAFVKFLARSAKDCRQKIEDETFLLLDEEERKGLVWCTTQGPIRAERARAITKREIKTRDAKKTAFTFEFRELRGAAILNHALGKLNEEPPPRRGIIIKRQP